VEITPPPATAPAEQVALAGAAVLIGAGDIAQCQTRADEATAAVVDSVLKADSVAGVHDAVFTLGDHAYPVGSDADFQQCFGSSWGSSSRRIMRVIRPAIGNHEHNTENGAPYYRYFKERAGQPGRGYYSYDLGEWHVVVLNSEIAANSRFPGDERTAQEDWLKKDLEDHKKLCTVAYFHRPLFSSGGHTGDIRVFNFWDILYRAGVDLVLNGHEHHYERFLAQTPTAALDTLRGMTQIIVGTGGATLTGIRSPAARNSVQRIQGHYGVLKLTLGAGEWRHAFLDTRSRIWDVGGGKCH
jgi:calcineurin-like phosphoesterase family protein